MPSATADVNIMATAEAARSVTLLFRGEAFRWGCDDEIARGRQRDAVKSHMDLLVRPLEARGHTISIAAAFHTSCTREDLIGVFDGRPVRTLPIDSSPNQAHAFGLALRWIRQEFDQSSLDVLIVPRLDLTLHAPLQNWSCDPTDLRTLSLASMCKPSSFARFNCTNDILKKSRY